VARYVTVATVSHRPTRPYTDVAGRLADAEHFAVRAKRQGADIVAFPEMYPIVDAPRATWSDLAETLADGPTIGHMAGVARREGMYLLWSTFRRDGDGIHNSAILFDRRGQVAGIYDKMFPTIWEIDLGVIPGQAPVVMETDFGRIGAVICYDTNFPDCVEAVARAGAEIIFFPSASRGGLLLRSYAHQFGVYFASAILNDLGQIVDMGGDVLVESTYEGVAVARINLDRRLLHTDFNREKWDDMLAKYGTGISLRFYTREGKFALGSELPDVTVDDLMREFGLETIDHYLARARAHRDGILERRRRAPAAAG
jgi:predicted amidohydrolase